MTRRLPPIQATSSSLRLPELSKLRRLFSEQEENEQTRVGGKALRELPGRRKMRSLSYKLANAYHRLAWTALQAMLFERASHYFRLNEAHLRFEIAEREGRATEGWEVRSWRETLALAGWLTGDMEAFAAAVRAEPASTMDLQGHVNTYFDWLLLGWGDDGSGCESDLEPAAERRRQELAEHCRGESLPLVQSLCSDDSLALAYFWRGDAVRARAAALRASESLGSWRGLKTKPRGVQLGSIRELSELIAALLALLGEHDRPPRPEAAAEKLLRYIWLRRKEPGGYLDQPIVLFLIALSRHDPSDPLLVDFRGHFPHLEPLVGGDVLVDAPVPRRTPREI